jgi:hypothetical protein
MDRVLTGLAVEARDGQAAVADLEAIAALASVLERGLARLLNVL